MVRSKAERRAVFRDESQVPKDERGSCSSACCLRGVVLLAVLLLAVLLSSGWTSSVQKPPRRSIGTANKSRGNAPRKKLARRAGNASSPMVDHTRTEHSHGAKLGSSSAIIAVAIGYPWVRYANFLLPLRVHYKGDVILLGEPPGKVAPEVARLCHDNRVTLETLKVKACATGALQCPEVVTARFRQIATVCRRGYTICLSTDFRDVFFQGDPFGTLLFTPWGGADIHAIDLADT